MGDETTEAGAKMLSWESRVGFIRQDGHEMVNKSSWRWPMKQKIFPEQGGELNLNFHVIMYISLLNPQLSISLPSFQNFQTHMKNSIHVQPDWTYLAAINKPSSSITSKNIPDSYSNNGIVSAIFVYMQSDFPAKITGQNQNTKPTHVKTHKLWQWLWQTCSRLVTWLFQP